MSAIHIYLYCLSREETFVSNFLFFFLHPLSFLYLTGTNDAFVIIALGKEKYQTSVKEKATETVEWCEQCEL